MGKSTYSQNYPDISKSSFKFKKYVLGELFDLFHIIPVTEDILRKALNSKINNYEDAVIEISSLKNEVNYIITRNLSDFKNSTIKALSPSEFLTLLQY